MNLEGQSEKIIKKLEKEGRVKTISKREADKFEHELAMALKPIKEEFYRKERNSRYYIHKLESKTAEI